MAFKLHPVHWVTSPIVESAEWGNFRPTYVVRGESFDPFSIFTGTQQKTGHKVASSLVLAYKKSQWNVTTFLSQSLKFTKLGGRRRTWVWQYIVTVKSLRASSCSAIVQKSKVRLLPCFFTHSDSSWVANPFAFMINLSFGILFNTKRYGNETFIQMKRIYTIEYKAWIIGQFSYREIQ